VRSAWQEWRRRERRVRSSRVSGRGGIVRKTVRKTVGVALIGVLGAFALQASAGAQEVPPDTTPPSCVILSVTPATVPAGGGLVTATGTVGADVHLTLYAQTPPADPGPGGPVVAIADQDVAAGSFSISGNVSGASDITLGTSFGDENAYTGGCATPAGEVVVRVNVAGNEVTRPAAAALAFTGSSDTPSYVLIGIAAIVLGAVLVVAARRRSNLS
jgi:LPXTG-motif cell wall-anchored protein